MILRRLFRTSKRRSSWIPIMGVHKRLSRCFTSKPTTLPVGPALLACTESESYGEGQSVT